MKSERARANDARSGRRAARLAKTALVLVSVLVLGVTGYAWGTLQGLGQGMTVADVIGGGSGDGTAEGPRDILLAGLGDRRDAQGNLLPEDVRSELELGDDAGPARADTIMLVRIPEDGDGAVGFSIPRDSLVNIPGFGEHKINSSYTRGKVAEQERLQEEEGITDRNELEVRSNQEAARTLIEAVEALTGVTIDNYASVNMFGFYEVTRAIGGVDVCLNNAVRDDNSGADFDAGVQSVAGADALAFVRQRHGLPRGDLDRVQRQQAFVSGLVREVLSAGTLTNPSRLNDLVNAVQSTVVLDQDWDLMDFAQQMSGLTGGEVEFHTVPVQSTDVRTADGLAVQLDRDQVAEFIDERSGDGRPGEEDDEEEETEQDRERNAEITVNVLNAQDTPSLAAEVSAELGGEGFTEGRVDNAAYQEPTVVRHAPGQEQAAERVEEGLADSARLEEDAELASDEVTVLIGADYAAGDDRVDAGGFAPSGPDGQGGDSDAAGQGQEPEDEPITADGVPCVN